MKQKIAEIVFESERDQHKEGFSFDQGGMYLKDFKKLINNISKLIPDDCKKEAIVDIHSEGGDYGHSSLSFTVHYCREETDEEERLREEKKKSWEKTQKEIDLREMERIKNKWGLQ